MANKFSAEFYVQEIRFLLQSPCRQAQWPLLQNRIKSALSSFEGRYLPKHGLEITEHGTIKVNNADCRFSLTINPKGNPFR